MEKKPTIVVTVSPNGEVKIKVVGISGSSCKAFSRFLEEALGEVVEDVPTEEFYARPVQQRNKLQQR